MRSQDRQAGYSSVGRASDCRSLQQSDGPWFDSGWPDFVLTWGATEVDQARSGAARAGFVCAMRPQGTRMSRHEFGPNFGSSCPVMANRLRRSCKEFPKELGRRLQGLRREHGKACSATGGNLRAVSEGLVKLAGQRSQEHVPCTR